MIRQINTFLLGVVVVLVVTGHLVAQEFYGEPQQQQCRIDPITGQKTCTPIRSTVKVAAAASGKVVTSIGAAITPNNVVLPIQPAQLYADVGYPIVHIPTVASYSQPMYSAPVSNGWSKSWSVVHGQPVRNIARRILGR